MKQPRFSTLEIDIASNARVSEFPPMAVPALMLSESHTLPRTSSCVIFRCMMRGQSPSTIVSFCSFRLHFICCLHRLGYDKFRLSSASR